MGVEADAFGTLSFEDDADEVALSPEFEALSASFWATRSSYIAGTISHDIAASRFRTLRLRDASGAEWTLGATSAVWYVRSAGSNWTRSETPPVGVQVDRSSIPSWVTAGIESVSSADGSAAVDTQDDGFNPFQRKSRPLLTSNAGNVRPRTDSNLDWVYDDWDDEDFSDGLPASLDAARAVSDSFGASAPVDREVPDDDGGFDLESLFLRPE